MSQDWITVFEALKAIYTEDAFSNIAINEAVLRHKDCTSGFVRTFTKGVLRESIKLDYYIDQLAEKGLKGIKNRTLVILRMGLFAIESLDSVPDHAAVYEAVTLAKKMSKGSDRFVNALLRSFIRRREELEISDSDLVHKYSFPKDLINLIQSQYGEETEDILKGLNRPAPLIIRTNLNRISRIELIDLLNKEGISSRIIENSEIALLCDNGSVISTEAYHNGLFSVQSLSSILAIERFAPKANSKVLDMCAAPGGKSCAMAEMMSNKGEILACDVYNHRLELITASANRLGIDIINTKEMDGTFHIKEYEDSFDYVLADVPCSGLGVIAGKPEIKLRTKPNEYHELYGIQEEILKNAISYAKPGAYIEYSTCTINKNENEKIVKKVIDECGLAQIIEINTIMPYNNMTGFFYCIMRKNEQ